MNQTLNLNLELTDEIPLDDILDESRRKKARMAKHERPTYEEMPDQPKLVPEHLPHMVYLKDKFKNVLSPMVQNYEETPDDVYDMILLIFQDVVEAGAVSEENFDKLVRVLQSKRSEWSEYAKGGRGKPRIGSRDRGHEYWDEKEDLVSFAYNWLMKGMLGSAQRFEPKSRPTHVLDPGKDPWKGVNPSNYYDDVQRTDDPIFEDIARIASQVPEAINETWLLQEEDPAAAPAGDPGAGGEAAAAPEQGAEAGQEGAEQAGEEGAVDPQAVEKAKVDGLEALKALTAQLDILTKAPDWDKVKADLLAQLKPYFG